MIAPATLLCRYRSPRATAQIASTSSLVRAPFTT